jgi:triosephosphate isomerase (TIM)
MKPIIIANWKSKPKSLAEAKELFTKIAEGIKDANNAEVVICPPFDYIPEIDNKYRLPLGAQSCFVEKEDVSNKTISLQAAREAGCDYIICGHSSRRIFLAETDEMINQELKDSITAGLWPILCLGETREEREAGQTEKILAAQLKNDLQGIILEDITKIIITYEPVWAISSGDPYKTKEVPTPEGVEKINSLIIKLISEIYGKRVDIRVIYGGSANAENSRGFLDVSDGLLVGGASLIAEEFIRIVKNA